MVFHGGAVGPSLRQENEGTWQIPRYSWGSIQDNIYLKRATDPCNPPHKTCLHSISPILNPPSPCSTENKVWYLDLCLRIYIWSFAYIVILRFKYQSPPVVARLPRYWPQCFNTILQVRLIGIRYSCTNPWMGCRMYRTCVWARTLSFQA